jgi:putative Mg2+ transporter-C (MgtC) family protein
MIDYFYNLYERFSYEDLYLVFLSIVMGLIIGAEREYKNKAAGLRTLMLVSVGSCTFTILSLKIGIANPDRLAANVVTGIGFLGAGAIFRDENKISGITTACTIWVTAALGMCIGSGHIYLGMLSTSVVLFVLWTLVILERWIDQSNRVMIYKITSRYQHNTMDIYKEIFAGFHMRAHVIRRIKHGDEIILHWRVSGSKQKHDEVASALFGDKEIIKVEV